MRDHFETMELRALVQSDRPITYGIVQPGEFVPEGIPLVRGGDYSGGWSPLSEIKRVRPEVDRPYSRSRLKTGDLVVTIVGANTGTVATVPTHLEGANITQTTARVAIDAAKADPEYIYQYFKSAIAAREVYRNVKGGAQPGLNLSDLEKFRVPVPPLQVQGRIAEILRTWDEVIKKTERLIAAKETAQFERLSEVTRDAESVSLGAGWVRAVLGDVTDVAVRRVKWDEAATYRRITVRRACGGLSLRGDALGSDILTKDMYLVKAGDFVISRRQVIHGAWAMARDEFDNTHVSKEYACLTARPDRLWMPYLDWLSRTPRLRHEALRCSYGVDPEKMVLNLGWLLRTPLVLPATIERQRKLAELLDVAQTEITLLKKQRDALAKQKRGLMQKLLPGEWRVPLPDSEVDALAQRTAEAAE